MYSFKLKLKDQKTLVLFTAQLEGDDGHYGYLIDKIIKRNGEPYSQILFLCPDYLWPKIGSMLDSSSSELVSNITRISQVKQINFYVFDGYADLKHCREILNNSSSPTETNKLKHDIITQGLLALIEHRKDKVIQKAPSGTVFQKPSGDKFSEFIKASELAVGFSENQFVAFALLAHRPRRECKHAIQHIWIDTSSIASYVEALIYFITKFNEDTFKPLQYHSFQSYGEGDSEGYKTCTPQVKDNVWVIISASRTNNLGVSIYEEWQGLKHDQIITLLSYTDSKGIMQPLCGSDREPSHEAFRSGDNIVVNISKFSDAHTQAAKHGYEMPVKIVGENFTAQVKDPTTVLLKKVHGPAEIRNFIEPNKHSKNLRVHCFRQKKLRPIFFDFEAFTKNEDAFKKEYLDWLRKIVKWYVPRPISAVIFDKNDSASCLLHKQLCDEFNFLKNIKKIDINTLESLDHDGAIIALLPVMTRGNSLIKLNSDLRLIGHKGQRIFITPFAITPSKRDYIAFESSLTFGPKGLKYQFLNFRRVFIGHQEEKTSWAQEYEVISGFSNQKWQLRKKTLESRSSGLISDIGISCDPESTKLAFNQDFAFWAPEYDAHKVNPSAVYLTVSAILQNLRETPPVTTGSDSLYAQVYQHSVLAPSNFSRFNDPLLQSCLWRCAYSRELDYRYQDDLSRAFSDIVTRLAQCRANGDHNATLDILIGIATQKIQLSKSSLQNLINSLRHILTSHEEYIEVLDFIENDFKHHSSGTKVI